MSNPGTGAVVLTLVLCIAHVPSSVAAQGSAYFKLLSIPPSTVGSCASTRPQRTAADQVAAQYKLVMTGQAPNRRREITVFADTSGRAIRYAEMTDMATGVLSSAGEGVIANIDTAGRVAGFRIRNTVRSADTLAAPFDTAALRKANPRAIVKSSNAPLDAASQRKVKELVAFVRKRCPI
jgi:hypothetical protein